MRARASARFRERDEFDHAFVRFARGGAEGEDAVLVQDQAFDLRRSLENLGGFPRQRKARHDVGHDRRAAVIDLRADRFAVGLIDQAQHCRRMRVVDEFVRQEGVQQRLDRRVWGHRIEQVLALDTDHVLVAELRPRAQLAQPVEPHRRQTGGLDRRHVAARTLDAKHLDGFAEQVRQRGLHRRIATAVQHELGVASQEARRIDPQREIGADALAARSDP